MTPHITVHLLDSALGHSLQTWSFGNVDSITVGRSPDNDVAVADPYVSRTHAFLKLDNDQWKFIAISRQLIVHEGQSVPEVLVGDGTVCRLGPNGCYLRFGQPETQQNHRATILFDETLMPVFK